ncbi:cytochrome c oxidase subunit II [Pseudooceanicola sp. LIPI14-2-Ac024]|uniref:cytochrome c oxidase subunit II n=1 Tax=Pseudooceanicola sp. LIPI14-2-Ac024 TaxID=3344875 RepID=UPI0035D0CEEB
MRRILSLFALLAASAAPVAAQDGAVGKPHPGGTGFQVAATELASDIHWLDHMLLIIITVIVIFVCALLAIVIVRYNKRANPTAASFTHNTPVEVAWTIVPIVILVFIGSFSLPVLFKQQRIPEGDVYVKVTGYQWYWGYEYTDAEDVAFDSYMLGQPATMTSEDEAAGAQPYVRSAAMDAKLQAAGFEPDEFLLAVDKPLVLPVGKVIVMDVTGSDVIHSWTVPAFGVKQDAVPGRIAQLWFEPTVEGTFFGQCSELCGKDHAYMPITVRVVPEATYEAWLAAVQEAGEYVPVEQVQASLTN